MKNILRVIRTVVALCLLGVFFIHPVEAQEPIIVEYIEKYITESLNLRLGEIRVYEFSYKAEALMPILDKIIKSNPELYYVGESFYYTTDKRGVVEKIIPNYLYNKNEIKNIKTYCDREIEKILFSIEPDMTDLQKALVLHEYMCENFSYDEELTHRTMFDLLRDGRGTCQALTLTYMELLRRVGINSSYAYSDEIMHMWNIVELDGEWYHVDITWDMQKGGISHKNFLLTDEQAVGTGHLGLVCAGGIECKDQRLSEFAIRNIPYKYVYFRGGFIFSDNQARGVYYDKLDGREPIELYRLEGLWKKGEGRYFANSFSTVVAAGNRVYFNTKDQIMQIDGELCVSALYGLNFDTYGIYESDAGLCCYLDRFGENTRTVVLERSLDADGDGEVTVLDIVALSAYIDGESVPLYKYNVDFNCDRILDGEDIRFLQNRLIAASSN